MFRPISRTDNMYVECQYTNYITWSQSCYRLYSPHMDYIVKRQNTTYLRWSKSCLYLIFSTVNCKLFVIIRISSLVEGIFPNKFLYNLVVDRLQLNKFHQLQRETFRDNIRHIYKKCFSWCKLSFSHLFSMSRAYMFIVIYQHNKASCRASEWIILSWLKSKFAIIFCKDRLYLERQ